MRLINTSKTISEFVNMMEGKFVSDSKDEETVVEPLVATSSASMVTSAPPTDNNKHPSNNVASTSQGMAEEEDEEFDPGYIDGMSVQGVLAFFFIIEWCSDTFLDFHKR